MESCSYKLKTYNSFDLAKFIASILVVMIHISPFRPVQNENIFSQLNFFLQNGICRVAVPLFFVFSGFFLYRKTPLDNFSFEPTKKYFLHILKMYILWTLIYSPLMMISISNNPNGLLFGFVMYVKNIFLVGSYSHLWYLPALLFAVLLISFLLQKNWYPRKILIMASVFYVFGLLGDAYYGLISPLFNVRYIGKLLSLYFILFSRTRNGLFFAFLFVSIGMILSNTSFLISRKKSLILFIGSIIMLYTEIILLKTFNIPKDYNVLLSTIPAAFYCFMFLKSLNLKDSKIYKLLRTLSSLIFYGHLWIYFIVSKTIGNTPVDFIITLVLTIISALFIIKLSDNKKFLWLKKLY